MTSQRQKAAPPGGEGDRPLFPPEQAFVVQFMADTHAPGAQHAGRVEHVISGRSARFDSVAALFDFIDQVRRAIAGREPAGE